MGKDFGQVKFKISFKYDLGFSFDSNSRFKNDRIYFAYTQMAFWDIYEYSAPMRDVNFSPMVFYEHKMDSVYKMKHDWDFRFYSVKLGYLHQSNGQVTGTLNRSIFKAFAHFDASFNNNKRTDNFQLTTIDLNLHLWAWNIIADQNKNIADYQGYGQLISTFTFNWDDKDRTDIPRLELSTVVIPSKVAGASVVGNLKVNPWVNEHPWIPYLYFQYWNGYGESLLNYDNRYNGGKRLSVLRVGVQFRTR